MPTIHIESKKSQISNLVLMPGDPIRAKYIAEKFLTSTELVNKTRAEYAYTGFYKNKKITVFSSGMGIPSMGIYSYELFNDYNVDAIIRIGTAGSYSSDLPVGSLFLSTASFSNSNYDKEVLGFEKNVVNSSEVLNQKIRQTAMEEKIDLKEGQTLTIEAFYKDNSVKTQALIEEMECYSLFINALKLKKTATAILTVTDNIKTEEKLNSLDRVKKVDNMIKLALESIIKL